ncbi:hypothetical protein GDO81_021943 [Engystomops pustulosus]|uniref:Uncharacterized protein n=1 Tax=Engystomops pustulosus TaxID=76066 RepID=A0AAV6ZN29_ENGPU|nr:hypothetical protein GDO81_021943 [Engystomops pustulosus]
MASLKRFIFGKEGRDNKHSSWRKLCDKWRLICLVPNLSKEDWNPWREWCEAFEEFESSGEKPPKSERSRAAMFSQLRKAAELTGDKLEEAKTMRLGNNPWKTSYEELRRNWDAERLRRIKEDDVNKSNLEKEAKLRRRAEAEKDILEFRVQKAEEELQQVRDKCQELEGELSAFQHNLVKCGRKFGFQVTIRDGIILVPGLSLKPTPLRPQLENGGASLPLDHITDIASRLGQVTTSNVFDWLRNFEEEYKISNWSNKDLQRIFFRCMDSSRFSSLCFDRAENLPTDCLDLCMKIALKFCPDIDHKWETEKMQEDDTVMEYFHRMWMIYRITKYPIFRSKDNLTYKDAICEGLLPHLQEKVDVHRYGEYKEIETFALIAERSWLESEDRKQGWYLKKRKAGPGCPPRWRIWRRLQNYPVPYEKIHNASYWTLLEYLSKYEDLGTWMARSTPNCA